VPGDPDAVATSVNALLADRAARLAATARARVLATGALSWDRQVAPLAGYCADVAAGLVAPAPARPLADAIVQLNDGRGVELADALRRIAWRAGNAWRLARTDGIGPALRRVWP
jgi:hypothetical protein